ncbi:MAG: S1 RNA-binding domain-containing protein [Myxococcales bacterium]|nr:S1 RNA-binding domain-containing protein [Myxococcales bacterium]
MSDGNPADSFAALFEAEAKSKPTRTRGYSPGQSVQGTVVRVGKDAVFVTLDGKREGYLDLFELKERPAVGDVLRAVVIAAEGDSAVKLGTVAPKGRGAEGLVQAMEGGLPVEGLVSGMNKGGLEVTVDGVRAFCPAKQVDVRFAELAQFIGQKLSFLVTQVKEGGREVVLSRRALLEREAEGLRAQLEGKLVPGTTLPGRVVSLRDFGAFVDLGGVEALLPASELSHDRGVKPEDVVKIGDAVDVQVLRVEDDPKRPGHKKITLSLKALSQSPWENVTIPVGEIREGKVVRHAAFGAFVQLAPGLDGLLHASEVGDKLPAVGEVLRVKVLEVDPDRHRISLGLEGSVTKAERTAAIARLSVGDVVNGKVSNVERFGVFLDLGHRQRGLLPASEIDKRGGDAHKQFPIGTEVKAKIVAIDGAGKVRLSLTALEADEERNRFDDFRAQAGAQGVGATPAATAAKKSGQGQKGQKPSAPAGLGSLGQKLAAAGLLKK